MFEATNITTAATKQIPKIFAILFTIFPLIILLIKAIAKLGNRAEKFLLNKIWPANGFFEPLQTDDLFLLFT